MPTWPALLLGLVKHLPMEASPSEQDFSPVAAFLSSRWRQSVVLAGKSSVTDLVSYTDPRVSRLHKAFRKQNWKGPDDSPACHGHNLLVCVPAQGAGDPQSCPCSSLLLLSGNRYSRAVTQFRNFEKWEILILAWFKSSISCCRAYCEINLFERSWPLHIVFQLA